MSMIGDFGVCAKNKYDEMGSLIENGNLSRAEELIKEIYCEVENSAAELENDKCSGEVFLGLFAYLKAAYGVDVRHSSESFGEKWRDITADMDVIAFNKKEPILVLEDTMNYDELSQFISEFFQADYGNAGEIAFSILLYHLKHTKTDSILIWHLF